MFFIFSESNKIKIILDFIYINPMVSNNLFYKYEIKLFVQDIYY